LEIFTGFASKTGGFQKLCLSCRSSSSLVFIGLTFHEVIALGLRKKLQIVSSLRFAVSDS
jgi:hypothetical protein